MRWALSASCLRPPTRPCSPGELRLLGGHGGPASKPRHDIALLPGDSTHWHPLRTSCRYIKTLGASANLFVDHSQVVQLECLRRGIWGTKSTWGRVLTYQPDGA